MFKGKSVKNYNKDNPIWLIHSHYTREICVCLMAETLEYEYYSRKSIYENATNSGRVIHVCSAYNYHDTAPLKGKNLLYGYRLAESTNTCI